jgi:hypothetical protein
MMIRSMVSNDGVLHVRYLTSPCVLSLSVHNEDTFEVESFAADLIGGTKFPESSPNFQKLFSE